MAKEYLERGRLFADRIESELMAGFECKMCGRTGAVDYAQEPDLSLRDGDTVQVVYAIRCACHESAFFKIRMPVLLFGQLLAMTALGVRPNYRSRRMTPIVVAEPSLLVEACIEVNQLTAPDKPRLGDRGHTTAFEFDAIQRIDIERGVGLVSEDSEE